ncbi:MAG: class I SAM-dependent methyltransferase [Candidatus Obscuribacter sp.]|nr:class I SAM-dependent methyltransferase [Candidatus Obscuribacter sp.]
MPKARSKDKTASLLPESLDLTPEQFQARSTSNFAAQYLPAGARVLDVGVGSGMIAKNLMDGGFKLEAVDIDPVRVKEAEALGIKARVCDFKDLKGEPYDAILFSRVLHHLQPLRTNIDTTIKMLKPSGLVIVEDFSYERVDSRTCAWLFPLAKMLKDRQEPQAGQASRHSWLSEQAVSQASSPEEYARQALHSWRHHHEDKHNITPFEHIKSVMQDNFRFLLDARVPYLFRYLADLLPHTIDGGKLACELAHWEAALAESGAIAPVGVRLVAKPKKKS